jgi:DNA-binding NarL/FixJ family response regulator
VSISVVIADDEAMVRAGLRMILDAEPDIVVAGEAENGERAVELVRSEAPDVVLMDVRMPVLDGIAATRALVDGGAATRVVMLTTFNEEEYLFEAFRAGTSGFLLKAAPPEQLVAALRTAAAGEALLDPAVTRRVIEAFADRPPAPRRPPALDELTPRELEVLLHLGRGASNAEIADAFVVEESTVKTHVGHVLMKLGLRDRVHAVIYAYESGLVRPGAG